LIRLTRQEKHAASFFAVVAGVVWTGAFLNWFGGVPPLPQAASAPLGAYSTAAVGDGSIQGTVNDVLAWQEATQAAEAALPPEPVAGVESTSVGAGQRVVASGDCQGIAPGFPADIAWRESRCTIGIDTGNGYLGYAQIALFHWQSGLCSDLDWTDLNQYNECVSRLWNGGAGASHWGA